jgi:hypothetical protein
VCWQNLSSAAKQVFNDEAKTRKLKMSGWNLFVQYAISNPYTYLGLKLYWSFNRTGTSSVTDISKNGRTGTLYTTWPTTTPSYIASKNDKLLNGLFFSASNQYVNHPSYIFFNTGSQTVSIWVRPDYVYPSIPVRGFIINYIGSSNNRFYFEQAANGNFVYTVGSNVPHTIITKLEYGAKDWLHFVITRDYVTKLVSVWVNGVKKINNQLVVIDGGTTSILKIGSDGTSGFRGLIDDFSIYNRILTDAEIKDLFLSFI